MVVDDGELEVAGREVAEPLEGVVDAELAPAELVQYISERVAVHGPFIAAGTAGGKGEGGCRL
jgi:hypothetical protein